MGGAVHALGYRFAESGDGRGPSPADSGQGKPCQGGQSSQATPRVAEPLTGIPESPLQSRALPKGAECHSGWGLRTEGTLSFSHQCPFPLVEPARLVSSLMVSAAPTALERREGNCVSLCQPVDRPQRPPGLIPGWPRSQPLVSAAPCRTVKQDLGWVRPGWAQHYRDGPCFPGVSPSH